MSDYFDYSFGSSYRRKVTMARLTHRVPVIDRRVYYRIENTGELQAPSKHDGVAHAKLVTQQMESQIRALIEKVSRLQKEAAVCGRQKVEP